MGRLEAIFTRGFSSRISDCEYHYTSPLKVLLMSIQIEDPRDAFNVPDNTPPSTTVVFSR